jgi:hypothetical protein
MTPSNMALSAVRTSAATVRSYLQRHGPKATIGAIVSTATGSVVRANRHGIWETVLNADRAPSPWADDEELKIIGPDRLDAELNPRLLRFLGGDAAADDLRGVRQGDRLLVVTINGEYVYSGYIYFNTTRATRRQKKIYAETDDTPVIGTCVSKPTRIWAGPPTALPEKSELWREVLGLLPAGSDVNAAAAGFANLGQFVYTARLSHQLQIPFTRLKNLVIGGKALWTAVAELRPDVDAMGEVRRVWDYASVHRRVLNDVFCYLFSIGFRRVINEVLVHNTPSQKANMAVGMTIRRELRDWTLLKRLVLQRVNEGERSYWRLFVA